MLNYLDSVPNASVQDKRVCDAGVCNPLICKEAMDKQTDLLDDEPISKTKRKEQMHDLQSLGSQLVKCSKDKLNKLDLPPILLEAIKMAQKITANGATRRQHQYIGKLMREVDSDAIRTRLEYLSGDSLKATQILHLTEKWRATLLGSDEALNQFTDTYGGFDIGELRNLVRSVRKEQELQQNRNFTKLFKLIRSIIEENNQ